MPDQEIDPSHLQVVPDFDIPGHSSGMTRALGDAGLQSCANPTAWPFEVLYDDAGGRTRGVLNALLKEMAGLFPDEYFSLGMDETCSPHNCTYVPPCSFNNTASLEGAALRQLGALGKTPLAFDEALFGQKAATADTAILAWQAQTPHMVAAAGHAAVEASGSSFYLNGVTQTAWHSWLDVTNPGGAFPQGRQPNDPLPPSLRHLLLGGEASMWSDNYAYTAQCHPGATSGGRPMKAPVAAALYGPDADAAFAASIGGMVWPRCAAAAGSFYRYDASVGEAALNASVAAFNERVLRGRGVGACPNGCACDELSMCGRPYLQQP